MLFFSALNLQQEALARKLQGDYILKGLSVYMLQRYLHIRVYCCKAHSSQEMGAARCPSADEEIV